MIKGEIRRLQPADNKAVDSLIQKVRRADRFFGAGWGDLGALTEYLASGSSLGCFSAEHNLLGFILCRYSQRVCEVDLLATDDSCWREGIMKRLFSELLNQESTREVWLEVAEDNFRARCLYEKFGFLVVGERPNYYGSKVKAILYSYFGSNDKAGCPSIVP